MHQGKKCDQSKSYENVINISTKIVSKCKRVIKIRKMQLKYNECDNDDEI